MKRAVAVLVTTLVALVAAVAPAQAVLPQYAWVFGTSTYSPTATQVSIASLPRVTRDYDVVLSGRTQPVRVSLTGVPIVELLKKQASVDVAKVPFVKIRFGETTMDLSVMLTNLTGATDGTPPPMIMDSGIKPGIGPWHTPAIVPGQPGTRPIAEAQIRPFDAKRDKIAIVPAVEGARIMSVTINKKRKRNGEYLLTARVADSPGGPLEYNWYGIQNDTGGVVGQRKRYATTDAVGARARHTVNLVVTSVLTGSSGAASFSYVSRRR